IVQLVRKQPPEHCILKIKSFSSLRQEAILEEGGGGHVSLYVALVDKLESSTLVYASLRFFIYDQIRDNYLTFLEVGENLFNAMKTARGIPKVLPIESFADASNGFLVNDCCTFGVGVFFRDGKIQRSIISPLETECERSYTWKIENFSDFSNLLSSPVFSFGEWLWYVLHPLMMCRKLHLYPRGVNFSRGKFLSLCLELHNVNDLANGSKLYTQCCLLIKNQSKDGADYKKIGHNWFHSKSNISGLW
ncbi:hypothetical protein RDABS01_001772, partial [Bienertia sinuspersici]